MKVTFLLSKLIENAAALGKKIHRKLLNFRDAAEDSNVSSVTSAFSIKPIDFPGIAEDVLIYPKVNIFELLWLIRENFKSLKSVLKENRFWNFTKSWKSI